MTTIQIPFVLITRSELPACPFVLEPGKRQAFHADVPFDGTYRVLPMLEGLAIGRAEVGGEAIVGWGFGHDSTIAMLKGQRVYVEVENRSAKMLSDHPMLVVKGTAAGDVLVPFAPTPTEVIADTIAMKPHMTVCLKIRPKKTFHWDRLVVAGEVDAVHVDDLRIGANSYLAEGASVLASRFRADRQTTSRIGTVEASIDMSIILRAMSIGKPNALVKAWAEGEYAG